MTSFVDKSSDYNFIFYSSLRPHLNNTLLIMLLNDNMYRLLKIFIISSRYALRWFAPPAWKPRAQRVTAADR